MKIVDKSVEPVPTTLKDMKVGDVARVVHFRYNSAPAILCADPGHLILRSCSKNVAYLYVNLHTNTIFDLTNLDEEKCTVRIVQCEVHILQ